MQEEGAWTGKDGGGPVVSRLSTGMPPPGVRAVKTVPKEKSRAERLRGGSEGAWRPQDEADKMFHPSVHAHGLQPRGSSCSQVSKRACRGPSPGDYISQHGPTMATGLHFL